MRAGLDRHKHRSPRISGTELHFVGDEAFVVFRLDLTELVLVTIELPHMVIESWRQGVGHRRRARL